MAGDTALIGSQPTSNFKGTDSAYVFRRTDDGAWTQQAIFVPDNVNDSDNFGWSLALAVDTALIGDVTDGPAGSANVFTQTDREWTQQAKLVPDDGDSFDEFGASVALAGDTALIGAYNDEDPKGEDPGGLTYSGAGAAYIFERTDGEWTQQTKLAANDGDGADGFGSMVALADETALLGAPSDEDPNGERAGSAYVFQKGNTESTN